jgi:prepilin-type N-terminal cleavage/methylation domain-containing protein
MHSRHGFTLLELLVVISIITIIMLVVTALAGSLKSGPPLEQAAGGIAALAQRVRQTSATQRVHGEIVLDYKNDRAIALARQSHVTFAFEDQGVKAAGSNGIVGDYVNGAGPVASRQFGLRDGAACEIPDSSAAFRIPWLAQFEIEGDFEGAGLAFDFYPMGAAPGRIVDFGSTFSLSVSEITQGACRLTLTSGGEQTVADTLVAEYRWCTVEIAVSKYGVRLYVDGRMSERIPAPGFTITPAQSPVNFQGFACRIDNLQFFSLVSSQVFDIGPRAQLLADGVWPDVELEGKAEDIYDVDAKPDPKATGGKSMGLSGEGLPDTRPSAIRHIFFDDTGKLDASVHPGAVRIALVSQGNNGPERMIVTFHPLGTVTTQFVERFEWEPEPAPAAPVVPAPAGPSANAPASNGSPK